VADSLPVSRSFLVRLILPLGPLAEIAPQEVDPQRSRNEDLGDETDNQENEGRHNGFLRAPLRAGGAIHPESEFHGEGLKFSPVFLRLHNEFGDVG